MEHLCFVDDCFDIFPNVYFYYYSHFVLIHGQMVPLNVEELPWTYSKYVNFTYIYNSPIEMSYAVWRRKVGGDTKKSYSF